MKKNPIQEGADGAVKGSIESCRRQGVFDNPGGLSPEDVALAFVKAATGVVLRDRQLGLEAHGIPPAEAHSRAALEAVGLVVYSCFESLKGSAQGNLILARPGVPGVPPVRN